MKTMYRAVLTLALITAGAGSIEAAESNGPIDEITNEIYVMNNHVAAVRVYAEDASGKLHRLGSVARGRFKTFEIPAEIGATQFRVKVFPTNPLWLSPVDDFGVKTEVLNFSTDHQITIWLESDLAQSKVEIDRG